MEVVLTVYDIREGKTNLATRSISPGHGGSRLNTMSLPRSVISRSPKHSQSRLSIPWLLTRRQNSVKRPIRCRGPNRTRTP